MELSFGKRQNSNFACEYKEQRNTFFPLRLGSNIGGFFMGDNGEFYAEGIGDIFPNAWYTSDFEDNQKNLYIISAEDMLENYKLKLIKWEIASPIHNSFS